MVRFSQLALALCLAVSSDAFSGLSHTFKASKCVETTAFLLPQTLCASKVPSTRLFLSSAAESAPKSTLVRKDDSSVEISILAPGPATKAAYDKVTYELSKTISVPGFRKGAKIPAAVLENAMSAKGGRNALRVQAIQTLLSQLLEPAFKEEHNLEPIGQPTLVVPAETLAEKFTPGEPIELTVRCDVWPDIKWRKVEGKDKPYMKLAHSYKRKPFNQKKLDMAIRDLKERYAELTLAPLEKELEMGDACVVNMVGYMAAADGISKGEPLPNAASGENVDIILGSGRYMDGLVEGLVGAKVGDTRTVSVRFPEKLRDKTLAGKNAIFDVSILEVSTRTVPEIDDELAAKIRPGLTAEGVLAELRKAVDEQESDSWVDARNKGLAAALSELVDVEVPDTLITNQAKEKYAVMMTDFRDQGMADDDIKKLISPENFLKYKDIEKGDIIKDFKVSMAVDEIARLEGIEVPSYQVDEQLEVLKKDAPSDEKIDENMLRSKVETTLQRRLVYDLLAEHGVAHVSYDDDAAFDENLMEKLAAESLKREEELAKAAASAASIGNAASVEQGKDVINVTSKAETVVVDHPDSAIVTEPTNMVEEECRLKKREITQRSLLQSRIQSDLTAKAAALARENHEAEIKMKEEEKARLQVEAEMAARIKAAEASRAKAATSEKVQRSLLQSRIQSDLTAKSAILARENDRLKHDAEIKAKEEEKARLQVEAETAARVKAAEASRAKAATSEKVQRSLLQSRIQSDLTAMAATLARENDHLKHEAEIKAKEEEKARLQVEAETAARIKAAEASRAKAATSEKVQRSLLQSRIQSDLTAKAATLARENDHLKHEAEIKAKEEEKARLQTEADIALKKKQLQNLKQAEKNQRSVLAARLLPMAEAYEKIAKEKARKAAIVTARSQPKPAEVEKSIAERYAKMDLSERAYNILKDLGMIDPTPDVDSPDYDHSADQDFVSS